MLRLKANTSVSGRQKRQTPICIPVCVRWCALRCELFVYVFPQPTKSHVCVATLFLGQDRRPRLGFGSSGMQSPVDIMRGSVESKNRGDNNCYHGP